MGPAQCEYGSYAVCIQLCTSPAWVSTPCGQKLTCLVMRPLSLHDFIADCVSTDQTGLELRWQHMVYGSCNE
ncbi:hypothetical protein DPMN_036191 [Dreissena polymorpha]|uniref:Uncharacterized protein n=1 Tax=Dreissena polymorpha TaxID=45954 RepID=A0A9D4MCH6_DREPO|nr:hypothetical protein DPMN_036191 [Dreissena polymorpha]